MGILRRLNVTIDGNGVSSIYRAKTIEQMSKEKLAEAVIHQPILATTISIESNNGLPELKDELRERLKDIVLSPLVDVQYDLDSRSWCQSVNDEFAKGCELLINYINEMDEEIVNGSSAVRYELFQSTYFTIVLRLMNQEDGEATPSGIVSTQLMFVAKGSFQLVDPSDRSRTKRLLLSRHFTSQESLREKLSQALMKQRLYCKDVNVLRALEKDLYRCSMEVDDQANALFTRAKTDVRKTIEGDLFDTIVQLYLS